MIDQPSSRIYSACAQAAALSPPNQQMGLIDITQP